MDWDDTPRWSLISKALGLGVPDPLETYHTSPHLFTDLDIPEGTTGRLPRAKRTRAGLDAEVLEDLGGSAPRSEGRGRGGRSGSRSGSRGGSRGGRGRGGRGRSARGSSTSSSDAPRSRGSRRGSQDGDRTLNAGKGGRSDRGTRGRGRGEHSPRSDSGSGSAGSSSERAPRARKRIHRRKGGE